MGPWFGFVTFDSVDPARTARWWAEALSGAIDVEMPGWVVVAVPGYPPLAFVGVPETKTTKNRVHLDLGCADRPAEVARLLELGASYLAEHGAGEYRWTVLADPDGNEFCVYAKER